MIKSKMTGLKIKLVPEVRYGICSMIDTDSKAEFSIGRLLSRDSVTIWDDGLKSETYSLVVLEKSS